MKKIRRRYSSEFKLETPRPLDTNGKSAAQIERGLDIGCDNLCRRKQKLDKTPIVDARLSHDGVDTTPGRGCLGHHRHPFSWAKQSNNRIMRGFSSNAILTRISLTSYLAVL